MATYYSINEANERLPELDAVLRLLRDQRRELVRLRDRYVELTGRPFGDGDIPERSSEPGVRDAPGDLTTAEDTPTLTGLEESRWITLRVRGIVDQMGASVARLDGWGVVLRDIESGLIDFPALVNGRPAWLCWRLGETPVISWWHGHDEGVAGRKPLTDLA